MNIKISKQEHEYLQEHITESFLIGSRLYGTARKDSDTDFLCIYNDEHMFSISPEICKFLPNYHQFQYDDVDNNTQYVYTSKAQFYKNLFSGDSTINADVVMFYETLYSRLFLCRTYNVIKAYIGFATRDLKKDWGKNKLFHAQRGLHCAASLLNNKLPTIGEIKNIPSNQFSKETLHIWCRELRNQCNKMFENGELNMYCIPALPKSLTPQNKLLVKLIESNNTKEFKYD